MKIEVWSDIICPWCGLGERRLQIALAGFPHRDEVEVVRRSFQLDPSFPEGVARPVAEVIGAKYGMAPRQLREMAARIEALAAADGLTPYIVGDNQVGSTGLAHQLLAYAADQGLGDAAWARLFTAYFGQARSIFDMEGLVALAQEIGLDPAGTRDALASRRYEAAVWRDQREAQRLGATGVPFFVIDRRRAIAGAQGVEVFRAALDAAWADTHPPIADGPTCAADGCATPEDV